MNTKRSRTELVAALLWAALYLASGYLSHALNGPVRMTGYIWLPAGVTIGAFMLRPVREWPMLAAAFLVAQLALTGIEHGNLFNAALFAIDEVGAAALAVGFVRRIRFSLEGLYFLRSVILAGVIAGVLGAIGGAAWYTVVNGAPFVGVGLVWAASDFVGVLLVTPVLASWSRFRAHRSGDHERFDLMPSPRGEKRQATGRSQKSSARCPPRLPRTALPHIFCPVAMHSGSCATGCRHWRTRSVRGRL